MKKTAQTTSDDDYDAFCERTATGYFDDKRIWTRVIQSASPGRFQVKLIFDDGGSSIHEFPYAPETTARHAELQKHLR